MIEEPGVQKRRCGPVDNGDCQAPSQYSSLVDRPDSGCACASARTMSRNLYFAPPVPAQLLLQLESRLIHSASVGVGPLFGATIRMWVR
jgi:hypothetical protein